MATVFGEYHGPVYKNPNPEDPEFPFEDYIKLPKVITPKPGMVIVAVPMELSGIVQSMLAQKSLQESAYKNANNQMFTRKDERNYSVVQSLAHSSLMKRRKGQFDSKLTIRFID